MSITPPNTDTATEASGVVAVSMRFEVTTLPVADVDRAKAFYQRLGWRLDIDFEPAPGVRGVQFTPPGSPASIQFGENTNSMKPGSLEGLFLVVDDIETAQEELIERGVDVGEIWHLTSRVRGRCRASSRSAARTSAGRPSRTPTATAGCSRRSPSGSRGGCKR
jgi:predicted enzyme related to lactoylglutathione lyase